MIVVAVDHNPLVLQCPKALIQSHCFLRLVYVKQFQTLLEHVFLEIFHPKKNIALLFLTQCQSFEGSQIWLDPSPGGQAVEGVPSPVTPPCLGLGKGKTEAKTTSKDYAQGWRLSRCYQCHEVKFCVRLEVCKSWKIA